MPRLEANAWVIIVCADGTVQFICFGRSWQESLCEPEKAWLGDEAEYRDGA